MSKTTVAIVGSGPAALMAADLLSQAGRCVSIFEKRPVIARKILIAGSTGLNVSNACSKQEMIKKYGANAVQFERAFSTFGVSEWLDFIHSLGLETFVGSSGRHLMKIECAAELVKRWHKKLCNQGVVFYTAHECVDFSSDAHSVTLFFSTSTGSVSIAATHALFALGGGSYEPVEKPLRWPLLFARKGLACVPFVSSNVGYEVAWSSSFLKEAEGKPLKRVLFRTARGERLGDLMITRYGLEGTPVYALGRAGEATLDLKPESDIAQIITKLQQVKENWSVMRRVQKKLSLCEAAQALLFHSGVLHENSTIEEAAAVVKNFKLTLLNPRPLDEAISSAGGVSFEEVNESLECKKFRGIYLAGEMLDWDAPTGGFLIQGCVSQGALAAKGMLIGKEKEQ